MIRIAANITLLNWDLPPLARVAEARARGFDGVECLFPYDLDAADWGAALDHAGLPMVLINTPEPEWDAGARGCAAIPGASERFMQGFLQAVAFARAVGCTRIHVMSGNTGAAGALKTYVENLRQAARLAPEMTLLIEPLNSADMPGYYLNDFALAARVLDAVDLPNVALQFDAWHALRCHGDVRAVWALHSARVGHVQIAGLAARGAPNLSCETEAGLLLDIAASGYSRWISAEYRPAPEDDTDWLRKARAILSSSDVRA